MINNQETNTILGVLGFLRLLIPFTISENICDYKQVIEIYEVCLYLLKKNNNHSITNASLEVINSILIQSNRVLEGLLTSHQIQYNEILRRRKSLKNQIFNKHKIMTACNDEEICTENEKDKKIDKSDENIDKFELSKHQKFQEISIDEQKTKLNDNDEVKNNDEKLMLTKIDKITTINTEEQLNEIRSKINEVEKSNQDIDHHDKDAKEYIHETFVVTDIISSIDKKEVTEDKNKKSLENVTDMKDSNNFLIEKITEDKSQILSDIDNESFNSIDFDSEITIGEGEKGNEINLVIKDDNKSLDTKSQKSTDSIGSFFNSFLSVPTSG